MSLSPTSVIWNQEEVRGSASFVLKNSCKFLSARRYDYGRQQMMDEDDEMEDGARGGFVFGGYSVPFSRNRAYEGEFIQLFPSLPQTPCFTWHI